MKRRHLLKSLPLLLLPGLFSCQSTVTQAPYENADLYQVGSIDYEEIIAAIKIDWACGEITLKEDPTKVGVSLEEANDLPTEQKVHSYCHDGILDIHFFASGISSKIDPRDKKLVVTYAPGLFSMDVHLTSGSLQAETLDVTKAKIEMTSGHAVLGKVNAASYFVCHATSGRISVEDLQTRSAGFRLTSGQCNIANAKAEELGAEMASGHFGCSFESIKHSVIHATSGSVSLGLPADGGKLSFHKDTGSLRILRECTLAGDQYVFGDGQAEIDVTIISGSLTVEAAK